MAVSRKEIALSGRLALSKDPSQIGAGDFSLLTNMRYGDGAPKSIGGQTAINTTGLGTVETPTPIDSMAFFRHENPVGSHLLAHAGGKVYRNGAVPPATGNFAAAMFTDAAGAGSGRFGDAPGGMMTYCNGKDTAIWGGTESPVGAVLNVAQNGAFKYDITDQMLNSLDTEGNVAVLHRSADTLSSTDTALLLHLNNSTADAVVPGRAITSSNVAFTDASPHLGTHAALFSHTGGAYITVPHASDLDFAASPYADSFTIDFRFRPYTVAPTFPIMYKQGATTGDYIKIDVTPSPRPPAYIGTYRPRVRYRLSIFAGGVEQVSIYGTSDSLYDAMQTDHVEFVRDDTEYYVFINGYLANSITSSGVPAAYSGDLIIGSSNGVVTLMVLDEFRISKVARHIAAFTPPTAEYGAGYKTELYIGSMLPVYGFRFYVATANTAQGIMSIYQWDGRTYALASGLSDGTAVTGVPLAQTGSVTITDTVGVSKVRSVDDAVLHWYKVEILSADATTALSRITLLRSMQQIQDTWSGERERCVALAKFTSATSVLADYTANVQGEAWDDNNPATYADLSSMAAADFVYFAATVPLCGVTFKIAGSYSNTQPGSAAGVDYWDGADWVAVNIVDETLQNGTSLGKSGSISWPPIDKGHEQKMILIAKGENRTLGNMDLSQSLSFLTMYPGSTYDYPTGTLTIPPQGAASNTTAYYYRLSLSGGTAGGTAPTRVYSVGGIPAPQDCRGYAFGVHHVGRNFLFTNVDGENNVAIYSAMNAPTVFNGADSGKLYFGDATKLVAAASLYSRYGSDPQNLLVVCKGSQTWMMTGDSPEKIRVFQVSDRTGCIAHGTMVTATVEMQPGFHRRVAVWLSQEGVVACDGNAPVAISGDISPLFDPQDSRYLGASALATSVGFVDPARSEYHLIVPGVTEYVYDFLRRKWFHVARGAGNLLRCGCVAYDSYGVAYAYGAVGDGKVYRLENGSTFGGAAIPCALETADLALENGSVATQTTVTGVKLVGLARSSGSIIATHYGESSTTGNAYAAISPVNTGKRLFDVRRMERISGPSVFHRVRVATEAPFEPLFLGVYYESSTNL